MTGKRLRYWRGGFASKRLATEALALLRTEVAQGSFVQPTHDTVEAYVERWLKNVRSTLKPTTWALYDGDMRRHVFPRIGSVPLAKLTTARLNDLYSELLATGRRDGTGGLSPKTVRGIAVTLGKALGDAETEGLIARSPHRAAKAPRPPRVSRASELAWGRDELVRFLDSWRGAPLYAFYRVAATTGMRRGEVLGLRWGDIDLEASTIALVRSVVVAGTEVVCGTPKSGRGRSIQLDAETVAALKEHRASNLANAERVGMEIPSEVFVHADGRRFSPHWVSHSLRDKRRALGLPDDFRLHDLRHLAATMSMQAGTPMKVVSERLGHASIVVTADIYSHVTPAMQTDAAEKLSELIGG